MYEFRALALENPPNFRVDILKSSPKCEIDLGYSVETYAYDEMMYIIQST